MTDGNRSVALGVIAFLLLPVWIVFSAIACIVAVLYLYVRAAWQAFRPSAVLGTDVIPPGPSDPAQSSTAESGTTESDVAGRDPAYPVYLVRQAFLDARDTVQQARADVKAEAAKYAAKATRVLVSDRKHDGLWPILAGLGFGAVLAAAFLAAGLAIAAAFFAGTLAVAGVTMFALLLMLGGTERLLTLVRGIQVSCPHDGGCRRFGLPVYACAECNAHHNQLAPNRNGFFRHVCRCGARLPTATVLGRYRLAAYCPNCERPLPSRIGTVPIDHIALIGESAYGKSTLMYMLLSSLRKPTPGRGSVTFVNHWDLDNLNAGLDVLRRGKQLPPTLSHLPHGVMVDVTSTTGPDRILYLFDPAGEVYRRQGSMQSQQYLRKAEYLIILVDPFALSEVRNRLSPADLERASSKDPSVTVDDRRDPAEVIDDLAATMLHPGQPVRTRRIAVVITKADALRETSIGQKLGRSPDDRRNWLKDLDLSPMLKVLSRFGAEVKFFASGLAGISGSGQTEPGQDEILEWCASPENVAARRLSPVFSRLVGSNPRRPRPPRPKDKEKKKKKRAIPLSYQAGRVILLGGQVAAVVSVPLLVLAFLGWLGM